MSKSPIVLSKVQRETHPTDRRTMLKCLLVASGSLLVGISCRRPERDSVVAQNKTSSRRAVTLTLWVLEENVETPDIYQQIVDEFMAANPEVRIVVERRAN